VGAYVYAYVDDPYARVRLADGAPMRALGGGLWRADGASANVCAVDRAGNDSCTPPVSPADDVGPVEPPADGGCCDTRGDGRGPLVLALAVVLGLAFSARSRSRGRRSRSAPPDRP